MCVQCPPSYSYLLAFAVFALINASCSRNPVEQPNSVQFEPPQESTSDRNSHYAEVDVARLANELNELPILSSEIPCQIEVPGCDLSVPEWAGKRTDEPFDVTRYLEDWKEKYSAAAECRYFTAMAEFTPAMAGYTPEGIREQRVNLARRRYQTIRSIDPFDPTDQAQPEDPLVAVELMKALQPALSLIDEAQKAPIVVFSTGLSFTQKLPHYEAIQILSKIGATEVKLLAEARDFTNILRSIKRTLRVSRDARCRASTLPQVVDMLLDRCVVTSILMDILPRNDLTDEQCLQLYTVIDEHEAASINPLTEGIKAEYVLAGNSLWGLEHGTVSFEDLEAENVSPFLSVLVNYEAEWIALNELFALALEECHDLSDSDTLKQSAYEQRARELKDTALPQKEETIGFGGKFPRPFVIILIAPAISQFREAIARTRARIGMIKSLLAIRRFELLHARVPESLASAFDDAGLGKVPDDPFAAQPLKLRFRDGTIYVYSTGSDGKDDNAELDWDWGRQPGDFFLQMPALIW